MLKKNKIMILIACLAALILGLTLILTLPTGCANKNDTSISVPSEDAALPDSKDMFTDNDLNGDYDTSSATKITLSGSSATVSGSGAAASGSVIKITSAGVYSVSGSLNDGYIFVDATSDDKIWLVLNNVSISNNDFCALYVKQTDKLFVTLVGQNTLKTTGSFVQIDDNNVDAAIFSKDDLTFNGSGSLTVTDNYGHGIVCNDDLVFSSGSYTITASSHSIKANDSVRIADGEFDLTAGKDGIHVDNSDDALLGYIYIADGSFTVECDGDALDSSSSIQIAGGTFDFKCGGGSSNSSTSGGGMWGSWTSSSDVSAKGIKANSSIIVYGGEIDINSADDAVHSNGDLQIDGGTFVVSSGDDGFHADDVLLISGGTINIKKSYEGIEGSSITISGGKITLVSSDDGLNAAGGNDSSSLGGRPGGNSFSDSSHFINITGGEIYVNAAGDGVDSNGSLSVSGGTTIVEGPTNNGNGALDYDSTATISGGTFVAVGSSGMAQNFSSATQGSIMYNVSSSVAAGSTLKIASSSGTVLFSMTTTKNSQSVVISTPDLNKGGSYTLTFGSTSKTITLSSNIYSNGSSDGGHF